MTGKISLLDRVGLSSSPLSENQGLVDQMVSSSLSEATKGSTLLAMFGAGAVSRLTRMGVMSLSIGEGGTLLPLLTRGSSYAISLANESATFAGIERGFHPSQTPFAKDWARAFINLGSLKLLGGAAEGQNLILQHLLTDLGMVGGQQVGAQFGVVESPQGSFAQQMIQAEALNWSQKGGMALLHGLSPNLLSMERSMDLYLRSREADLSQKQTSPFFSKLVPEGPGDFSVKSVESEGSKGPDRYAMASQGGEGDREDHITGNDFLNGSGHLDTDTFYADLRRINQTRIPDKIDSIPEGSRKIVHSGNTLYISPKALEEMENLNRFVAEKEYAAEIFGFGLTHPLDQHATLVADFIRPRQGKVAVIGKGILLSNEQWQLIRSLAHSETLRLSSKEDRLFLVSNNEGYSFPIDKIHWDFLRSDLQPLMDQELATDWDHLKRELEKGHEFPLKMDWDMVVSGAQVHIMESYLRRVIGEAQRQKAQVRFAMHYHPALTVFARFLEDADVTERHRYYETLLAPSQGDVGTHLAMGVQWFEIRALGTPDDLSSQTKTTSAFYRTSDLKQTMRELQEAVEVIIHLSPSQATPDYLVPLLEKLREGLGREKYAEALLQWAYRDSLQNFMKPSEDIRSVRDLVLFTIFSSRGLLRDLQKLTPSLLRQHVESNTFELYGEVLRQREKSVRHRERISAFLSQHKIYGLPFEKDPTSLRIKAEAIAKFLGNLAELPPYEDLPLNIQGYSIMEGQKPGQSASLSIRHLGDDLFGFEGCGFLIFQGAKGWLRTCGLLYCSRLTIFDPTTRIAVDSHLPVYFDDFDAFKIDLERSMEQLRRRGVNLESSRITLIYGRVVRPEDKSRGWYPGQKIVDMLKDLGVSVNTAFPADQNYDFNLETGEIVPVPEGE